MYGDVLPPDHGGMETNDTPTVTPTGGPSPGRRLTKSRSDRVIAGVAGGLGEYFGVDAVLFRIGFVALSVAGGSGLVLYGLAWLVLPEVDDHDNPAERLSRWFHQKPVLAIIGTVIAVNLLFNGLWWDRGGDDRDGLWAILLVIGGIAFLVNRARGGHASAPPPPLAPPQTPTAPDGPDADVDPLLAEAAALDPMAGVTATSTMWPPATPITGPPRPRAFLTPVTLSLLLVGGGIAALAGASLQTFLALALLLVGAVMLIGSRRGRARGLLAVGLLLAAAATAVSVTDVTLAGGTGERDVRPLAATQPVGPYRLGVGELRVDLSQLDLTGTRTVQARVGMGKLTVLVPPDVDVVAVTRVGLGEVKAFGQSADGSSVDRTFHRAPDGETAKRLRLELRAGIGEINVEVAR